MGDTPVNKYGVVSESEIDAGGVTDAYFCRTEEALDELESNPEVVAEVSADQFESGRYEMVFGVKYVAELLTNTNA